MKNERRYDLDWLRVIAFALLMLFHTGMMFSTWDWHVKNIETSDAFNVVMQWLHAWRMPLLFLISGSAVWFAMERLSGWRFFVDRQKRLLWPLVFGMLVVIPPQVFFERLYHNQQYTFRHFYLTVFTLGSYPEGNLSWHHLWYIPYIWAYSMMMLPVFLAFKTASGRRVLGAFFKRPIEHPWLLILIFIPSALAEVFLRPRWPGDADNLTDDWANFTHKLTFFVIGFCLASSTKIYDVISHHRRKFLVLACVAVPVMEIIWAGRWHISSAGYRVVANANIWAWLLALLGYGRTYLNFNNRYLKLANEAVYPFYILHQTVIIAFAYQLAYVNWSIPLKFLIVVTGTFIVCTAIYAFAIRPWNIIRPCFGMKVRKPSLEPTETNNARTEKGGRLVPSATASALAVLLIAALSLASCTRKQGAIVCRTLVSSALATNALGISQRQTLAIYLPPSYQDSTKRFPVLYWLPNFKCDLWRYMGGTFQGFRFDEAMDRAVRSGFARDMIIVVPNAVNCIGSGWYRNSPVAGNWDDYVAHDVVAFMDDNFRTIHDSRARALAGHGVGGLGALELGLKHADTFSCVYAMSPAIFDEKGISNLGPVVPRTAKDFSNRTKGWAGLKPQKARQEFLDYIQPRVNSPDREKSFGALLVSYAAAVNFDAALPFPHFTLSESSDAGKLDSGMGGWEQKLQAYLAKADRLKSITIEYGRDDEYEFLRRGSDHLSALMTDKRIANQLAVHDGSHESRLGQRMEEMMLPAVSSAICSNP